MRWSDVDYLCNGLRARIRFTIPADPLVIQDVSGTIKCAGWGYRPVFWADRGGYVMNPGAKSLVILEK